MQDENDLNERLTPVEREVEMALGALPIAAARGRDELMYNAGARSARRTLRLWRSATVGLAACMAVAMYVRRETSPAPQIVRDEPRYIIGPRAPAVVSAAERGPFTLASLNQLVRERGVDALPSAAASAESIAPVTTPSPRHNRSTDLTPGDPL